MRRYEAIGKAINFPGAAGDTEREDCREAEEAGGVVGMMVPRVPVGDLAEFINGVAFKPDDWEETGRRIIRIQGPSNNPTMRRATTLPL